MKLNNLSNGELRYSPSQEAKESVTTKDVLDGVTVTSTSAAIAAVPAFFEAAFFISCDHEVDGLSVSNIFHLKTVVPVPDSNCSYREIEDRACKSLPDLLRDLATEIEKDIARANAVLAASEKP